MNRLDRYIIGSVLSLTALVGLGLVRHVLEVEPLASAQEERVVALVGPVVQAYLLGGPREG